MFQGVAYCCHQMALLLLQLLPFPVQGHGFPVEGLDDNLEDCRLDLELDILIDIMDFNHVEINEEFYHKFYAN